MNLQGLSLEQAPPYIVPNIFFVSAFLFGAFSAVFMLFGDTESIFTRFSFDYLGIVHLFVLGVFANVMMGASFQMLPVIAGATYKKVKLSALSIFTLYEVGVISLVIGFLTTSTPLLKLGALLIGSGVSIFVLSTISALKKSSFKEVSINGFRVANLFFLTAVIQGVVMLFSLFGEMELDISYIVTLHSSFGMFGWVFILIVSVAFWVVPMFYVTTSYPLFCKKFAPQSVLFLLLILPLFGLYFEYVYALILFTIPFLAFAISTFARFKNRKRKTKDGVVNLWILGVLSLILSALVLGLSPLFELNFYYFGVLFGFGFVLSIITGMILKIVPFLTWFHLSFKGVVDAPLGGEIVSSKTIMRIFYIHLVAFIFFILGAKFEFFFQDGGVDFFGGVFIYAHPYHKSKQDLYKIFQSKGLVLLSQTAPPSLCRS